MRAVLHHQSRRGREISKESEGCDDRMRESENLIFKKEFVSTI